MATTKSAKIWAEMEKVKAKISDQQTRLKELEQKHKEAVFYLVIDRQRETENVYFLNAVTVADLMALAESSGEPAAPEPTPEPDPEPDPTPEPEPVPEKKGGAGPLLLALAVVVIGGGAGWYFKIYRPKHQKAAEPEEDYGGDPYDGLEDYDGEAPWDENNGEPEE